MTGMSKPKQDRRRYIRIKKSFLLTYFDKSQPGKKFEITQLKNISLGGMCFITSHGFDPATELSIELKTPYLAETTHLTGVVLESHEKMKNRIYETRLEFKDLDTEAKILLEKLMSYFLNGKSS